MPPMLFQVKRPGSRRPAGTKSKVVDLKGNPISREEEEKRREEMIRICTDCHSRRFAVEQLENADQVKEEAFKLQGKGEEVIRELEEKGLLYPSVAERFPHPTEGQRLILSDPPLYIGTSDVEGRFFRMFNFHAVKVW